MRATAFQIDSPASLNPASDTSIMLMQSATVRGLEVWHYHPSALYWRDGVVRARMQQLHITGDSTSWYTEGETHDRALSEMDVVWMRQNPPFDMGYITATHLLEHAATRVVNNPAGVRGAPEKLSSLYFAQFMPPTLISADAYAIADFAATHKVIVAKPLYGYGGRSVFKFSEHDGNLDTLLEQHRESSHEPLMWQKFLPEVRDKDRRILLINGEVKAVFGRTPMAGSIRANMRVGGTPILAELTDRQREICAAISPMLKAQGLLIVGLDVIGDYLTEINVTSPTGFRAAQMLYNINLADMAWDAL